MPVPAPAYAITGLIHRYQGRTVLDVPQLTVDTGETLGIVGPSGAGKSTLLRLLQLLEAPSEGEIVFDGRAYPSPAPARVRRRITTVFQRPLLLDRSVRGNVAFGLQLRGRQVSGSRVDDLLARLGLTSLARSPARTLSGGEIQRVALARALAVGPDVLLLDEPAANLDPANVAVVEQLVREEQQRGTTIVLVTHNAFEARRLADRTALLLAGTIIEVQPTPAFFASPIDVRTRAFLNGEMVY
jgi:tungstate transport system ATP-binding protein